MWQFFARKTCFNIEKEVFLKTFKRSLLDIKNL